MGLRPRAGCWRGPNRRLPPRAGSWSCAGDRPRAFRNSSAVRIDGGPSRPPLDSRVSGPRGASQHRDSASSLHGSGRTARARARLSLGFGIHPWCVIRLPRGIIDAHREEVVQIGRDVDRGRCLISRLRGCWAWAWAWVGAGLERVLPLRRAKAAVPGKVPVLFASPACSPRVRPPRRACPKDPDAPPAGGCRASSSRRAAAPGRDCSARGRGPAPGLWPPRRRPG